MDDSDIKLALAKLSIEQLVSVKEFIDKLNAQENETQD